MENKFFNLYFVVFVRMKVTKVQISLSRRFFIFYEPGTKRVRMDKHTWIQSRLCSLE